MKTVSAQGIFHLKKSRLAIIAALAGAIFSSASLANPREGSVALTESVTNGQDIDGELGAGYLITGDSRFGATSSVTVGNTTEQTLIHNFSTQGGAGSGGGAGLGGVFFVDANAILTLINTDLKSNRVQGGTGGGDPTYRFSDDTRTVNGVTVNLVAAVASGVLPAASGISAVADAGAADADVKYTIDRVKVGDDVKPLLSEGFNLTFSSYNDVERELNQFAQSAGDIVLDTALNVTNAQIGTLANRTGASLDATGFYFADNKTIRLTRRQLTGDDPNTAAEEPVDHQYFDTLGGLDDLTIGSLIVVPGSLGLQYTTVKSVGYDINGKMDKIVLDDSVAELDSISSVDILPPLSFQAAPFKTLTSDGSSSTIAVVGELTNFKTGMDVTWEEDGDEKTAVITSVDTVAGQKQITIDGVVASGVASLEAVENPLVSDDGTTSEIRIDGALGNYDINELVFVPNGSTGQIEYVGKITGISSDNVVTIEKQSGTGTLTDLYVSSVGLGVVRSSATVDPNNRSKITMNLDSSIDRQTVVGRVVSGEDFGDDVTVTDVDDNGDGTVTLTLSEAVTDDQIGFFKLLSPLSKGGNMNNIANIANSENGDGQNGNSADDWTSYFEAGDGGDGNNGQSADDPDNGVGFDGGDGGSGSNGMNTNPLLAYDLVVASYGVVAAASEIVFAGMDLAGVITPDILLTFPSGTTAPDPVEIAAKSVKLGFTIADMAFATADLVLVSQEMAQWNSQLANGLAGRGGDGGEGGEGSGGADFFGGGTGGDGGDGGDGGQSSTHGGDAGDGGRGGDGGFGAGGGTGGDGGSGGAHGFAYDGDPGEGGFGGFGAGDGMRGDGAFGNGGSGFGGAIFVRESGTLNIEGNALFELNYVAGGSTSSLHGTAGTSAGSDLFIMKGANVTLSPGLGNTIRFEGDIADDSRATDDDFSNAAGDGADITIAGAGGLVVFNGENTYSGDTILEGASLTAEIGQGIHDDSLIRFNGTGGVAVDQEAEDLEDRVVSTLDLATTGTLLLQHDYARRAGSDPGETSWTGSGGFASSLEDGVTVNLGKLDDQGRGQQLVWGQDGFFVGTGLASTLTFGSEQSVGAVTFTNSVDLNGELGRVAVYNTGNSENLLESKAFLTGAWSNGGLLFGDAESYYDGVLHAVNQNELTALFATGGVLTTYNSASETSVSATHGELFDDAASTMLFEGSMVHAFADDTLTSAGINPLASLVLAADLATTTQTGSGDFVNAGNVFILGEGYQSNTETIDALRLNYLVDDYSAWSGGLNVAGTLTNSNTGRIFHAGTLAATTLDNDGIIDVVAFLDEDTQTRTLAVTHLTGDGAISLVTSSYTDDEGAVTTVTPDLVIDLSGDSEFAGVIAGSGNVTKAGAGNLQVSGAQAFTGDFKVSEGYVETLAGGTFADEINIQVASGAQMTTRQDDVVNSITINAGAVFNQDANITTSTEILQNGSMNIVNDVVLNTGTAGLKGNGNIDVASDMTMTIDQSADSTFSGSIAGAGGFVKSNSGTLTLSGAENSLNLQDEVVIEDGVLAIDGAGILAATSNIVVRKDADAETEGTLHLVNGDQDIQGLAGEGLINLGDGNDFNVENGGEFTGRVVGRGRFNVEGGDFQISSSITSDEGSFTVNSGAGTTTTVAAGAQLAFPLLMVEAGSTIHLGGTDDNNSLLDARETMISGRMTGNGTVNGLTQVSSTGLLAPGNSPGVITFDNLELLAGSSTLLEVGLDGSEPGINHDQIIANSLLIDNGAVLSIENLLEPESGFLLNQRVRLFNVLPGQTSGTFGTINSEFENVALNLATGELVGLGAAGIDGLRALAGTANQQSLIVSIEDDSSADASQFYGGRLVTDLLDAVQAGTSTARVFELSSPEAYRGAAEYSVFAMDQLGVEPKRLVLEGERATSVSLVDETRDSQTRADLVDYDVSNKGMMIQNDLGTYGGIASVSAYIGTGDVESRDLTADVTDFGLAGGFTQSFSAIKGLQGTMNVGFMRSSFDSERATTAGTSDASFDVMGSFAGAGLSYTSEYGAVTTQFAFDAVYKDVEVDQATETNSSDVLNALQIDEQNQHGTESMLSVGLGWSASSRLRLGARLAFVSSDMQGTADLASRVASELTNVTTRSQGLDRSYGLFSISAEYAMNDTDRLLLRAGRVGDGATASLAYLF